MHIYGPVPSRRLGYSLGVDILPSKTCSLDCIYCQLGHTDKKTVQRKKYFDVDSILSQIKNAIAAGHRIDYITFSGSGDPPLNVFIGKLIQEIKKNTSIPVAVLTNGTLLLHQSVRHALSNADLVVPSLDAATQEIFERVNRPHPSLKIRQVLEGLKNFRQEFCGKIWLEILFVKGMNDSPAHLKKLKKAVAEINPDKIQLNTVIRPPVEKSALALNYQELEKIREFFGTKAEIVAEFDKIRHRPESRDLKDAILAMVARRPVTLADMSKSLGKHKNELNKYCDILLMEGKIRIVIHEGKKFFKSQKQKNKRAMKDKK
ncbi:MAG: radical SAM protein [Candidatus Aminicenantes bacterium]|nr:MAG: radical SAM protein [Candidatus Aminicenantes bacterium]